MLGGEFENKTSDENKREQTLMCFTVCADSKTPLDLECGAK